ncbi:MAG: DUF1266 domain-containing protein [Bacteroidales bacterium]|jgi:hypothetical protein|nr:DUF1266 domain-containing protein [Bacteroidales bacterium]
MINWNSVATQLTEFVDSSFKYITDNNITIMNNMVIYVDYLGGYASLIIENPESNLSDDADEYVRLSWIEIDEWTDDVSQTPSMTDDAFHYTVYKLLKDIIEAADKRNPLMQFNPILPFSIEMKQHTFPLNDLFYIPMAEEQTEKEMLRGMMNQNMEKSVPGLSSQYEDMMSQMQQMYGNIPGMEQLQNMNLNEMISDTVDNIVDSIDEEEDEDWELRWNNDSTLNNEQQHALSVGSIMRIARGEVVNALTSNDDDAYLIADTIKNQWDVYDHDSAIHTLDWLKNEGHRDIYIAVKQITETTEWYLAEDSIRTGLPLMINIDTSDEEAAEGVMRRALSFYDNMKQIIRINKSSGEGPLSYPETISSWDYGRLVNMSCWSYECGYITEDEAWSYINFALEQVKKDYRSWSEYAETYLFGRKVWNIDDDLYDSMEEIVHLLLNADNSPWKRYSL